MLASLTSRTEGSKLSSSSGDRTVTGSPLQQELADLADGRARQLVDDLDADRALGLGQSLTTPLREVLRAGGRRIGAQDHEADRHLVADGVGLADDRGFQHRRMLA